MTYQEYIIDDGQDGSGETQGVAARSPLVPVLLGIPVLISLVSWLGGGMAILTDSAFVLLSLILSFNLVRELLLFPERQAVGRLVLYGGSLVWFCHDYFSNICGVDFNSFALDYSAETVAKGAFFTTLFILMSSIGLMLPTGTWMQRLVLKIPTPSGMNMYLMIIAVAFVIGVSPFFLFTAEPFYMAMYKSMTAMRGGEAAMWTVGRSGNYNTSWGAYIVHLMQVGEVGALLSAFVVVMLRPGPVATIFLLLNWLMVVALQFGTGSRGPVLAVTLPVVALVYIKYAGLAREQMQRYSKKAIFWATVLLTGVLMAVQIQAVVRGYGLRASGLSEVDLFKNQGNTMFSEGLIGYYLFPDHMPFPRNSMPGEGAARFLPDVVVRFAIGWIPRVIWTNKPGMDDVQLMINERMTGGTSLGGSGGTIANGISGYTYIRYGAMGVVEVGLLFGWLAACVQASLRWVMHRPFALLITLGLATWLFRCFRDLTPHDLYPLLVGSLGVIILCGFARLFGGSSDVSYSYEGGLAQ